MEMNDIIHTLKTKYTNFGITLYPPATLDQITLFESNIKITLPDDIKTFYRFCNGFESAEDMFRIIPLEEIELSTGRFFYIAEYLIYCDIWGITINTNDKNDYVIFNETNNNVTVMLTKSFSDFLKRFLDGGVFGKGGLYDWHTEVENKAREF